MCECVIGASIAAGWGCHHCRTYNGIQRSACRNCKKARCSPLLMDRETRKSFETLDEAYADDPERLAWLKSMGGG